MGFIFREKPKLRHLNREYILKRTADIENLIAEIEEMESILNLAKEEKRAISEEENAKFEALEKEVQNIDNTISKNERLNKIGGMKEVKEVEALVANAEDKMATYKKERKEFDNVIRGIINEDTPTTKSDMSAIIPTTIWDRIIDEVIEHH